MKQEGVDDAPGHPESGGTPGIPREPGTAGVRALLRGLLGTALSPERGFRLLAERGVRITPSLGRLALLRGPVAFAEMLLAYAGLGRLCREVLGMQGPVWDPVLRALAPMGGVEDIRAFLESVPPPPSLGRVWPWLLLAAPLYVASLWCHDAVWDHAFLWLLGGTKARRGFGATLVAESEALQVGVLGALLALLTGLPSVGWLLSLPVGLVGMYFWILRGFSLAAFHGCPTWKGVAATLLHAALLACVALGAVLLLFILLAQGLA